MLEKSLVSVFINAYNAEKYIMRTLNSVINQTYKNLQIIVVDDCSTDNTYEIIKSVNDDRIEIYQTSSNNHMSYACNEGLKHIKGDYVAHIDADDTWQPDKIEKQVKFLEENQEYGACFTYVEIIDENGNIIQDEADELRAVFAFENRPHAQMYRYLYDNSNRFSHSSPLIRTKFIKMVGDYDVSILYLQDYDYWMRLITKCPIFILPEKLNNYRIHSKNNSKLDAEQLLAHNNEFFRIAYKSINMCPDDLFLEAFSDKLKLKNEHTHKEVEIEKAFLLLEGPYVLRGNQVLGIAKFAELLQDEEMVELIKNRYGFTTRDFYKLQSSEVYAKSGKTINKLVVYYDYGTGYSESEKDVIQYFEDTKDFSLIIPDGVKAVRIDPVDNVGCIITDLKIKSEIDDLSISTNADVCSDNNNMLVFFNKDPQIVINADGEFKKIDIEFNVITLFTGVELEKAWLAFENVFCEMTDALAKKGNAIIQKEKIIDEQKRIIELKNEDIKDKDDIIKNKDGVIKNKDLIIADFNVRYTNLTKLYTDLINSFFWRLTSPARRVSHSVKIFLTKHARLLEIAIFTKGFLRHGVHGGKRALSNYRNLVSDIDDHKLTLEIPKCVRKYQSKVKFSKDVTFSILVPLYNTPMDFLEQMIESVQKQTYSKWELCLADGSDSEHSYVKEYCLAMSKKDKRIKYSKLDENRGISENTNECLKMATGNYIALFDHDDILDPTVLFEYMQVICDQNADFIYCDEDKFNEFDGELYDANYKPDFAADNLRSNNYICHFTVFDKSLIEKSGAFRKEFDGSQDHDLILRLTEQAKHIVHIPKVLYHWRVSDASVASDPYAKPYTIEAGKKAVAEHLERVGLKGTVESTKIHPNIYRIKYDIIGNPLVSIIIPNYNHVEELSRCIDSIINKSTYKNYEIIIVENNSDEETFAYYDTLKKHKNIKVVVYKTIEGFNYSAINNYGVKFASGEHYILLNNDVEIITPEWIEEMLMYSQRDDVGAVGAMLYYPNDTIQHAGVTIGVLTLAGHNFKHSARGNPGYFGRAGYQQNVSAVTAACLMLPAKVYEQVNGLDESFAVAFNDIDFCMRIRQAGYHIIFTPFAELYHYESISRGNDEAPEKRARFVSEVERFQKRWKKELKAGDPYYNPNLTLDREDFSLK